MKRTGNRILTRIALCLFINALSIIPAVCQQHDYEAYYLRSNNFPDFPQAWTPTQGFADREIQGVTHDNANWYFTWTDKGTHIGYLWKVPVDVPLDDNVLEHPNVLVVNTRQFRDLNGGVSGAFSDAAYWHWGDPDHYTYSGTDYIIVPMTGAPTCSNHKGVVTCMSDSDCGLGNTCNARPVIGIFHASDLSLAAYGSLPGQTSTGWCAIDPRTGNLYTSEDFDYAPNPVPDCDDQSEHFLYPRTLLHYSIPWNLLIPSPGYIGERDLTHIDSPELLTGDGRQQELYNMQGGEFTPSGELLYISSGSGCCLGHGDGQEYALDGVRVFETRTWKEITRSNNHRCVDNPLCPSNLPRYFDYYYRLGCDGSAAWSPEGLTIWDRDEGGAPNINGQLHVLLFKFNATDVNRDVFEHFGGLHVDPVGVDQPLPASLDGDAPLPGALPTPFKTLGYAYNAYPDWDGAEIVLQAGLYPETGIFSRRVRLKSRGGVATIGR